MSQGRLITRATAGAAAFVMMATTLSLGGEPSPPAGAPMPSATPDAGTVLIAAIRPAAATFELEARYDVDLFLHWGKRRIRVDSTIDIINTSGSPVGHLQLNTIAAKLGRMRGLRVFVDGDEVTADRVGQTIRVPLADSIGVGEEATIRVRFRAKLTTTTSGRTYLFSKNRGIAHLYRWVPWLSRRISFGTSGHGEPFVTASSPEVRVRVDSNRDLRWATTGKRVAKSGKSKTFLATDVRDFNLTASPTYRMTSGKSKDRDTTIVAYTRRTNGRRLVDLARTELARYERITGVEYPHKTYRVAESGGGLAMESPGLIWIPGTRPPADQPFLVSHETAHQWFYAIVGNDQSTDAFADEALADYYSRRAHLSLRPSRCKTARLDREIRRYSSSCYFEVIYVQGARFLDGLRRDFGSRPFRKAIRDYAKANAEGIASNKTLLETLRDRMGNKVLKRYRKRFPSLY